MDWRVKAIIVFLAVVLVGILAASGFFQTAWAWLDPVLSWWKYALFLIEGVALFLFLRSHYTREWDEIIPDEELWKLVFGPGSGEWRREQDYTLMTKFWPHPRIFSTKLNADEPNSTTVFFFWAKPREEFRGTQQAVAIYNKKARRGERVVQGPADPKAVLDYLQTLDIGSSIFKATGRSKSGSLSDYFAPLLEISDDPAVQQALINSQTPKPPQVTKP